MSQSQLADPVDTIFHTVLACMLPFFLPGARGDAAAAHYAIIELIENHNAATGDELDLIGRMVCFSNAAMGNLRLSMQSDLSATKVLQYRAGAVALGRSAEQCRKTLEAVQAKRRQQTQPTAAPARVRPEPPSAPPRCTPQSSSKPSPQPIPLPHDDPEFTADIEAMQRNAHAMLAQLQARTKTHGPGSHEGSSEASLGHAGSRSQPANQTQQRGDAIKRDHPRDPFHDHASSERSSPGSSPPAGPAPA